MRKNKRKSWETKWEKYYQENTREKLLGNKYWEDIFETNIGKTLRKKISKSMCWEKPPGKTNGENTMGNNYLEKKYQEKMM